MVWRCCILCTIYTPLSLGDYMKDFYRISVVDVRLRHGFFERLYRAALQTAVAVGLSRRFLYVTFGCLQTGFS